MPTLSLTDPVTGSTALISSEVGFNCFSFQANVDDRMVDVIDAADGFEDGNKPPSHSGIPLLFPFPNRIRSGRYSWDGVDYHLPESLVGYEGAGNAIHGFCLDRPWRVKEQTESSVTGVFQFSVDCPDRQSLWPADAEIEVKYSLNDGVLRSDITVRNPDTKPLPWGFGTHAYFKLPLHPDSTPDGCTVYAPVSKQWQLQDCLPTGQLIEPKDPLKTSPRFGDLQLDDVYTNVEPVDGIVTCRIVDEECGIQLVQRCDHSFREIVAFTPPWTTAVCLEPYTCTTDAINLQQQGVDAGLKVLGPGESWNGWIETAVGSIVC